MGQDLYYYFNYTLNSLLLPYLFIYKSILKYMSEKQFENPRNSAGEFLYYDIENIKDIDVEGEVLNGGFNDGLEAIPLNK